MPSRADQLERRRRALARAGRTAQRMAARSREQYERELQAAKALNRLIAALDRVARHRREAGQHIAALTQEHGLSLQEICQLSPGLTVREAAGLRREYLEHPETSTPQPTTHRTPSEVISRA